MLANASYLLLCCISYQLLLRMLNIYGRSANALATPGRAPNTTKNISIAHINLLPLITTYTTTINIHPLHRERTEGESIKEGKTFIHYVQHYNIM